MKKLTIMSMILFAVSVIIFGIFFVRERFLKDRTGPVFQLESSTITVSVKDDYSALLKGVTASDAADGDITGSIISATLLTVLPEKLRFIGDFRMLIYAIVLIAVMLVSNNRALMERLHGLAGRFRKKGRAPSPAVAFPELKTVLL